MAITFLFMVIWTCMVLGINHFWYTNCREMNNEWFDDLKRVRNDITFLEEQMEDLRHEVQGALDDDGK